MLTTDELTRLNLPPTATADEVRQRCRVLLVYVYHPDRFAALPEPDRAAVLAYVHKQSCGLNATTASLRVDRAFVTERVRRVSRRLESGSAISRAIALEILRQPSWALMSWSIATLVILWLAPFLMSATVALWTSFGLTIAMTASLTVWHYLPDGHRHTSCALARSASHDVLRRG